MHGLRAMPACCLNIGQKCKFWPLLVQAMLEAVAAERRPNSRLPCQIKASAALQGQRLVLPDTQE